MQVRVPQQKQQLSDKPRIKPEQHTYVCAKRKQITESQSKQKIGKYKFTIYDKLTTLEWVCLTGQLPHFILIAAANHIFIHTYIHTYK